LCHCCAGASPEFTHLLARLLDKNPATRIKWQVSTMPCCTPQLLTAAPGDAAAASCRPYECTACAPCTQLAYGQTTRLAGCMRLSSAPAKRHALCRSLWSIRSGRPSCLCCRCLLSQPWSYSSSCTTWRQHRAATWQPARCATAAAHKRRCYYAPGVV
jgi:hypothetical protein